MTDEAFALTTAIQRIHEGPLVWDAVELIRYAKLVAAALLREQKRAAAAEARVRELEATQKFATEQPFATIVSGWRR